jgi:hypothetical protein
MASSAFNFMKNRSILMGLAASAAIIVASGCGKQEPVPAPQVPKVNEATVAQPATTADTAAGAAQQAADQGAVQVKATQEQAQGVIDKAQTLVNEKKYQDALSTLSQLASLKLTPEQQKLVDDLKAKIQSALTKGAASDAASALGGGLGGKK